MNIESLKKVKLEDGDVLLVEVDIGALPTNRANQFMNEVRELIVQSLGPIRCMIIPMHRMRVSVLNVEDAVAKEIQAKDALARQDK